MKNMSVESSPNQIDPREAAAANFSWETGVEKGLKKPGEGKESNKDSGGSKVEEEKPYGDNPKEQELFKNGIKQENRVFLGGRQSIRQRGEKNTQLTTLFSGESLKKMANKFQVNSGEGTILFVDNKNNPWLTAETHDNLVALKKAGYEQSSLSVPPLSRGEDFGDFGGAQNERLSKVMTQARETQADKKRKAA